MSTKPYFLEIVLFVSFFMFVLVFPKYSISEPSSQMLCSGFNKELGKFGPPLRAAGQPIGHHDCPEDQAFIASRSPGGPIWGTKGIPVRGFCCPLPRKDILSEEKVTTREECPYGYVATGSFNKPGCSRFMKFFWSCPGESGEYLRCTKINLERYQLGKARIGIYWGAGSSQIHEDKTIRHSEIPAAIRAGIGRVSKYTWAFDGCIGEPIGSLLVGKKAKYCKDFIFRELQYAGKDGDPPKGTAVKMYSECESIDDVMNPNPSCI